MRIRRIFALWLIALTALAGAFAETDAPELLEPVGVDLDFARAEYRDIYTLKQYAYSVVPYIEELCFAVDGVVQSVDAYLGAQVRAGDVLITLDETAHKEREAELTEQIAYYKALYGEENRIAEIDIEIAELECARMRARNEAESAVILKQSDIDMRKLLARQAREEQDARLAALEGELEDTRAKLGKNTIVAPFDGTVVWIDSIRADSGVSAYDTVIKLADDSRKSLSGEYLSDFAVSVAKEIYARIGGSRYEIEYVPVDMEEYFSTIFAGGKVQARFAFLEEPEGVNCGDYAAVCMITGYCEGALSIPTNALYVDEIGKYVYKLENNARVRVAVKTGANNGLYVQITEGLEEGDRVYVKE